MTKENNEIAHAVFSQRDKDLYLFPKSGSTVFSKLNFNNGQFVFHKIDSQEYTNRYFGKYANKILLNTYDSSLCYDFLNKKVLFISERLNNISIGGVFLAGINKSNVLKLWNFIDNKFDKNVSLEKIDFKELVVSPSVRYFIFLPNNDEAFQYDIISGNVIGKIENKKSSNITDIKYSRDSEILCVVKGDSVNVYSSKDLKKLKDFYIPGAFQCFLSNDNKYLAVCTFNNKIELINFDTVTKKQIFNRSGSLEFFKDAVVGIEVTPNNKYLIAKYSEGSYCIWRIEDGKFINQIESVANYSLLPTADLCAFVLKNNLVVLFSFKTEKIFTNIYIESSKRHIIQIPEGFYKSSPGLARDLSYFDNKLNTISFDQLDIKYNRPDKVLQAIGSTDTALIDSYKKAYLKRIKKLGVDTTSFKEGFTIPEADFKNRDAVEYEQKNKQLTLQIAGSSTENLDRINVWINEVPLYGQKGINLRLKNKKIIDTTITVNLSEGDNQVETSITDVNGIESYRQPLFVKYVSQKPTTAKTYFIGLGINRFSDSIHNLNWSVKDIRDLANKFASKGAVIDTLFDEGVTIENVLQLKKKLLLTGEEDKVIIAYSGHGLLSSDYDYFLSTYAVNFNQPQISGLPYEELENLLDGIKARKKLLLIDACHSGEVDKEEMKNYSVAKDSLEKNGVKGFIITQTDKNKIGMKNSFEMMQELFVNVGRGTGTTVISAAAGTQFALERGDLKNGVFTYCLLDAMRGKTHLKYLILKRWLPKKYLS
ncbi:MAG: caspase family protein [Chitinophagaceae bacterium]|nr:caspase family protein [Chitinophagaceae bacterium]